MEASIPPFTMRFVTFALRESLVSKHNTHTTCALLKFKKIERIAESKNCFIQDWNLASKASEVFLFPKDDFSEAYNLTFMTSKTNTDDTLLFAC